QKTLFTWGVVHLCFGVVLWAKGQWNDSLALTGFAYLVIFDAFGVFTTFASTVLITYRSLRESSIKHPFGVQRYEVLLGFINTIYLIFVAMYVMKESLEHLLLESSEDHYDESVEFPLLCVLMSIGATLVSAIGYQNHKDFRALFRSSPADTSFYSHRSSQDMISMLKGNIFILTTLFCGIGVLIVGIFTKINEHIGWLDIIVSICESILMFYIGIPLAIALGKILLQTTPETIILSLEACLQELQERDPAIVSITQTHVWQNSYGQLIGSLIVQVTPEANDQTVLEHVYQRLGPLLGVGNNNLGYGS
ncbi:3236_t:CDS:2, partial [Paraglomus occultum]